MNNFIEYLIENKIAHTQIADNVVDIDGKSHCLIKPQGGLLFDEEFKFIQGGVGWDYHAFLFGGRYYRIECGFEEDFQLDEVIYVGKADVSFETTTFLGVHGGYELLRGSRSYEDWCKKAKFLGLESLGICEKGTLAGTMKFQQTCLKNEIKPILGASYSVKRGSLKYDIKLYAKDEIGWMHLLELNYINNVENNGFVCETDMFNREEGLYVVVDPKTIQYEDLFPLDLHEVYYQLDTVHYKNEEEDKYYLQNLKKFIDSDLKPVLLNDAYYLEKRDYFIKDRLETIGKNHDLKTYNQYFKSNDDVLMELSELSKDDDKMWGVYTEAVKNSIEISDNCNFEIDTKNRHLPKYIMTEEERLLYKDNKDMFMSLIEDGLMKLYPDFTNEHIERIEYEMDVLETGGVVDYFLNTRDVLNASTEEHILTGVARGSSGGSIISYLLGIIKIDPIQFDLLFDRFLTKDRLGQLVDSEVFEIEMSDGSVKTMYPDTKTIIIRDGNKFVGLPHEIKEGDEIL